MSKITLQETGATEIWTLGGQKIDFVNPSPEMINMETTAVSLANQARYCGYTEGFYSIAQHSTIMSYWIEDIYEGTRPDLTRAALLHDAGEAWIGEMVTPFKRHVNVGDLESRITQMIFVEHGLDPQLWDCSEIHELDLILFNTEVRDLKPGYAVPNPELCIPEDHVTINPQMPDHAFSNFVMRYNMLFPERRIKRPYQN